MIPERGDCSDAEVETLSLDLDKKHHISHELGNTSSNCALKENSMFIALFASFISAQLGHQRQTPGGGGEGKHISRSYELQECEQIPGS